MITQHLELCQMLDAFSVCAKASRDHHIAFGLISTAPGMARTVKNLQVHGGCHNGIKLLGKIYDRCIIAKLANELYITISKMKTHSYCRCVICICKKKCHRLIALKAHFFAWSSSQASWNLTKPWFALISIENLFLPHLPPTPNTRSHHRSFRADNSFSLNSMVHLSN